MDEVIKITDDVSWIGIRDYDIVTFDVVMTTEFGTTYNSYFINADKKTIVETSKLKFWDKYKEKILSVVDPKEIEYIILDHTEPDHSGNLANLLAIAPNAKVVASAVALRNLKDQFDIKFESVTVKDGDTLDLGNKTIKFFDAVNLHWPDTIYSYLVEDKILFSCDSFGAHYCSEKIFNDEIDGDLSEDNDYSKAFKYYFDVILKPFSKFYIKAIDKIRNLDIKYIATGHGPIIRKNIKETMLLSEMLAAKYISTPDKKYIFIPYVSAYGNTAEIAEYIAEGIKSKDDFEVETLDIEQVPIGEIDSKITRATAVLVGSPTINQNILLPIYKLFAVINPIRDRGKLCSGFGSFGWSGESRNIIAANLKNLKLDYFGEGVFFKFSLINNRKDECIEFGKSFAETLIKKSEV
ncbi:MAG: FprA family A-type flavoprotein [Bacteroidales bacterium]|jgi:flavorubredoxin|nr:FprA family A-type flavoprotein [Bacteroidales bacterium]